MDGELCPLLDTVEGEREWEEVDKDREFHAGMCAGSNSGSLASATIAKGAKESFSDYGSREYGGVGSTGGGGGVQPLLETSRYQSMRSGIYRSITFQA